MLDPEALFRPSEHLEAEYHAPRPDESPTLLVTLGSYGDAGNTQELINDHLLERFASHKLGDFDVDQLFDYTGRRPPIVFDRDHFRQYQAPQINLHQLTDATGNDFLLLTGPEPSLQWERMAAAVQKVIDRFGVERTVILQSFPASTPHTRPIHISGYATDPTLLGDLDGIPASFEMGASFLGVLTLRLGEQGKDVIGLVAHVPHYVAESSYPEAAIALLGQLNPVSGLVLPSDGQLDTAAKTTREQIEQQVAQSDEAQMVVAQLEDQYERFMSQRALTSRATIPTADQIGAEVEEFLKGLGEAEGGSEGQ